MTGQFLFCVDSVIFFNYITTRGVRKLKIRIILS